MDGSCYVHKCMSGYQLSADNSMCMDEETIKKFTTITEFGWEWFSPTRLSETRQEEDEHKKKSKDDAEK